MLMKLLRLSSGMMAERAKYCIRLLPLVLFWAASATFLYADNPTCSLSVTPPGGIAPLKVKASGGCTDNPMKDIVTEGIDWGDGSKTAIPPKSFGAFKVDHAFAAAGTFTVVLTAIDKAGNQGTSSQQIVVLPPNAPPSCTLNVAPTGGPAPLAVTANGACSDPENDIVSTVINWGDGASTQGTSGTHTYPNTGTFHVVLTATDSAGGIGSASQTVVVGPATSAPPMCSMQLSSTSGKAPLTVTVDANCTDPENDIKSTVIDFGDGFYATGTTTHTFVRAGTFSLTVVATDSTGNVSNTASGTVSVSDDPTLFVGVSNGQVKEFDQSGDVINTLNTGRGGSVTGMSFDSVGSLYVTNFTANGVTKFADSATVVGDFGTGYNCKPESIVFDNAGNAYVGETGCSHALLKFDSYGNLLASFQVTTETEGSDWIDLAADQCTILYTSQGASVFSFNACTNQQGPTLTTGLNIGLGLRMLPDGGTLIANKQDIVRLDSAGRIITRYNSSGESCWVSLTLDPDGKSFWAVDYCSSDIIRFDITSGNQLTKFNSGTPTQTVFGIAMRGATTETSPAGPLIASPPTISVAAGQSVSLQLAFSPSGAAMNQNFTFTCANLPRGATCSFSPTMVMPTSPVSVNVSITTSGGSAGLMPSATSRVAMYAIWLLVPNLILLSNTRRTRKNKKLLFLGAIVVSALIASLLACGSSSRVSTGSGTGSPAPTPGSMTTPAATYPIVIQAKSNSLASSTVVNLSVQ
jgi:PKD repeat protein